MGEFRMPSLGADMDVGTIVEWRVQPGDVVSRGDIVAVVDTDKATIDVEVFESGTIDALLVPAGEEVPVGTPLARITPPVPTAAPSTPVEPSTPPPATRATATPRHSAAAHQRTFSPLVRRLAEHEHVDLDAVRGTGLAGTVTREDVEARVGPVPSLVPETGRVRASPLARRRARDRGIDLTTLTGTGPGGAVLAADLGSTAVDRHAAPPSGADRRTKLRAALGVLMSRSKREIPHYYLSATVDLSAAVAHLARHNEARAVSQRVVPAALLLRATALACSDVPGVNGHWIDGGFRPHDRVDLGVAISLRGGGIVAPALGDAAQLGLDELMAALRGLVDRTRRDALRSSDLVEPTLTVTNLGDQGVDAVFGVITPPQVALVGFGRVAERPWAEDGEVTARPTVTVTLAADHRVTDGHEGARYLTAIDRRLQRPEQL